MAAAAASQFTKILLFIHEARLASSRSLSFCSKRESSGVWMDVMLDRRNFGGAFCSKKSRKLSKLGPPAADLRYEDTSPDQVDPHLVSRGCFRRAPLIDILVTSAPSNILLGMLLSTSLETVHADGDGATILPQGDGQMDLAWEALAGG